MPSPFSSSSASAAAAAAAASAAVAPIIKRHEFILHSHQECEGGYVEVTSTDTLSDVRRLILEDFDPEQLPSSSSSSSPDGNNNDGDTPDSGDSDDELFLFAFRVNGIRISAKQESRKNALELLEQTAKVELVPKKQPSQQNKRSRAMDDDDEGGDVGRVGSMKRARMMVMAGGGGGAVTPFEPAAEAEGEVEGEVDGGKNGHENENDDSSTIATGSSSIEGGSSVLDPVQLDTKFAAGGNENKDGDDDDSEATVNLERNKKESEKVATAKEDDSKKMKTWDEAEGAEGKEKSLESEGEKMTDAGNKKSVANDTILEDVNESTIEIIGMKKNIMASDDILMEDIDDIETSLNGKKKSAGDNDIDFSSGGNYNDMDVEEGILEVVSNEEADSSNPHKVLDIAKRKSHQVLTQLATILRDNPDFCSETRRKEWLEDIKNLTEKSAPKTVFGVLGNTGVGKSSLLNSLMEEAAVLPTSGSRGCTATVVELVFNWDLLKDTTKEDNREGDNEEEGAAATALADTSKQSEEDVAAVAEQQSKNVPVYKGEVEFITLEDWRKELKALVNECSTQEKTIYAMRPEEDRMPDAAQAWQKIEQVYGKGAMEQYRREPSDRVFNSLAHNLRVKNLLTAKIPGQAYNSIVVKAGEVIPGSDDAKELLKGHGQMKSRAKSMKKKWGQEFRTQINSYVYRMGNGDQPQTWPLIRKVQLQGPWLVLNSGAILVDLPGVKDSNAARAKVAENYLMNCNQIAIVAPIKRAVDDGTAKELLGEQFKRRLLMDGNYGNVFFLCTQTDDIEATETMRDHADVAQEVPGRWEKMTELADGISEYEKQLNPLLQQEEDFEEQVEDAKQQYKDTLDDLNQAEKEMDDDVADSDVEEVDGLLESLKVVIADNKSAFVKAKQNLGVWKEEHSRTIETIQGKCDRLQKKLKALCSTVRNEYSKQQLQSDFKSGLKELYRKDDDDGDQNNKASDDTQTALPEEFNMDVFCISANDYLKLMKIKPSRDGPPSTFSNPRDTQVPQLRSFVHETTARFQSKSVKSFVENTNDVLDQMKLLAADVDEVPTSRLAFRMKSLFESTMNDLASKIHPIGRDFQKVIDQKIQRSLVSSLQTGAQKGSAVAMTTVNSWGSKSRRTKSERRPEKNGLYYSTYGAVARREGVYTSSSAGAIDFNQELCDPMEKEFSTEWQSVLDSTTRKLLSDAERKILQLCTSQGQAFAQSLRINGVDAARLTGMLNTANRSAISALKASFGQMGTVAVNAQRELSRELLPAVKERMKSSYERVNCVMGGTGKYVRMKDAMHSNSQRAVHGMFDDAMGKLLTGIQSLIKRLKAMIESTSEVISKTFSNVFSICWDDQQSEALVSPEMQKVIRECRDNLLPVINELVEVQGGACELLGIQREEVELQVMEVETFEQTLARRKEEAKKNGDMFDLCDSDTELDIQPKNGVKVKAEKKKKAMATPRSSKVSAAQSDIDDVIDLCDSDDDDNDYNKKPAASKHNSSRVKDEAFL